jgi:DNA repair exonuclease SbcCD nuclease subunit
MLSLLWRTDVHCRAHTPESRKDDWGETVARKLTEVGEIARKHQCVAILDGGDLFDDKLPVRTPHRLVSRVARIHAGYPCKTYGNVGNHDVRLGKFDNLVENPLETLFSSGAMLRLYDEHEAVFAVDGVKVRVVGVPYHGPRYDLDRFRAIERHDEDWLVVCAHVLASPQGGEMFKNEDIVKYADLEDLAPSVDVFCFGHWHKNQGIEKINDRQWVVNVGSLTRGALTEDNVEREPGVVVMGFWPKERHIPPALEFVKIGIEPGPHVFDLEKRVKAEARAMTVDAFVESVKLELQSSSDKPFDEIVATMDIPDEVRERALEYIEKAARG